MTQLIGSISDTHGLVRPQAINVLRGVNMIVHAGDIGSNDVIDTLQTLAPVTAVRGNVDTGSWASRYPERQTINIGTRSIFLLHNLSELELDPAGAGIDVVISGHSHQPKIIRKDGVMYLNPGSAGPRRFKLPVALALLRVDQQQISPEIVELI